MAFLPELTSYLKEHGAIYTVRRYDALVSIVTVDNVGQCKRRFIKVIYAKEDLEPYVKCSGFENLGAWWQKIMHFIPRYRTKYLYVVTVL